MDANQQILPLNLAGNQFLQALVTNFEIRRTPHGCELTVRFDGSTPAIWLRAMKGQLRKTLTRKRVEACQLRIDAALHDPQGKTYRHADATFPFRWANGGTLPLVRMGCKSYAVLFYRDEHPVGWNLANGASDNLLEMRDPFAVVERELREELLIVGGGHRHRYVFGMNEGRPLEHPEFVAARHIWDRLFKAPPFSSLQELEIPLHWMAGPDTVRIEYGHEEPVTYGDCFVNVNAEDFGIEIDRVAVMNIDEGSKFCDGEMTSGNLQDRVVGLFPLETLKADFERGSREFRPPILFRRGRQCDLDDLDAEIEEGVSRSKHLGLTSGAAWKKADAEDRRYDLCPVTRTLLRRSLAHFDTAPRPGTSCDLFVSYPSEDIAYADRLYKGLQRSTRKVFFCPERTFRTDFSFAMWDAVDSASAMVAVCSNPAYFQKNYFRAEWNAFYNSRLNQRKKADAPLIVLLVNMEQRQVVAPLHTCESVKCSGAHDLQQAIELVDVELRKANI